LTVPPDALPRASSSQEIEGGRRDYHGKDEVLRSNHQDKVKVQCVNGPCSVISFEEYMQMKPRENPEEEVFYTREFYDAQNSAVLVRAAPRLKGGGSRTGLNSRLLSPRRTRT
jgi:hypothetical protein